MDSFPHSMSEDTAVWTDGVILWRWLDSTTDSMDMKLGKLWEMVMGGQGWCAVVHGVTRSWTQLNNNKVSLTYRGQSVQLFSRVQLFVTP